jgi:hypothetical protein
VITLFRTIQAQERDDVLALDRFRTVANSISGKEFWHTDTDARRFARLMARVGVRPSWFLAVELDIDPADARLALLWLDGRQARFVEEVHLDWFNERIVSIVMSEEL